MSKWIELRKPGDFRHWGEELGIDPLCARVIRNRGIETVEDAGKYLEGGEELLHDPFLLPDMDKAVDALMEVIKSSSKIRIIGDYDVDGVTSVYILITCIRAAGGDVSYAIPNRQRDGYGINDSMVDEASADGVDLIITCDNGISASDQIRHAYDLGLKVIVTDHHQVPFSENEDSTRSELLPDCLAVVDPHREGSKYPFKGICGAMVAYKFMTALYMKNPSESLAASLKSARQFAALGTVCDVMELIDENRAIVKLGISDMEHTDNIGIKALMDANSLTGTHLTTYAFGFVIGPSINSTGRLEDASESVGLLLNDDAGECMRSALRIRELNDERKDMTAAGFDEAVRQIEENNICDDKVMVIYLPDVHESIAGLIAGRLKEKFYHPVLVITRGEDGLKGSGRSIPAYNMFEKFSEVKHLFTKMGGHAMAAGFSLNEEDLPELKKQLNELSDLKDEDFEKEIQIDAIVPIEYASIKLCRDLEKIEPVGTGNAAALFAQKDVMITNLERMGKESRYGKLTVKTGRYNVKVTYFGDMDAFDAFLKEKCGEDSLNDLYLGKGNVLIDMCYEIKINNFNGNEKVDYRMKYYR